jgi:D-serine deaminase-like pyridoxal phosphate-dependent protein
MTSNLSNLSTPAVLVDEARMMRNIQRMHQHIHGLGARFRPHIKTSKCIEVARRQQAAGANGITVSTLKEAEQFFAAGFAEVLYAVCIAPDKLPRALALRQQGCGLTILVDSLPAAQAVVDFGRAERHAFEVMIEIDSDGHRSGVDADGQLLLDIGRVLHEGGAVLKGVMTHAGSSYELSTPQALERLAEQECSRCAHAAEQLRGAGLPCREVSVGSTPTALSAKVLDGVTEVRAGVYVFFDLVMANVGVCRLQDIALSVLTTVIGHQPDKGWVIVDAGWMAMSRDRGTARQKRDYGYGAVCAIDGVPVGDFVMIAANQEHGVVSRSGGEIDADIARRFPLGTRLRILPNHACATGAQFSEYHAVAADQTVQTWKRFDGW